MGKLNEIMDYKDLPNTFDFWFNYLLQNFDGKYGQLSKELKKVRCHRLASEIITKKAIKFKD